MKYLFEDRENGRLQELFTRCYSKEAADNIIFTDGSGNLLKIAYRELSSNPNENIVIFIDTIYDNLETVRTYNILALFAHMCKASGYPRVMVIPVVCTEHYMIKSLGELRIANTHGLMYWVCSGLLDWRKYDTDGEIRNIDGVTNFEQCCKAYLKHLVPDCVTTLSEKTRGMQHTGEYYIADCQCGCRCKYKRNITLEQKSASYVTQYPCFPRGVLPSLLSKETVLDFEAMTQLNRSLCKRLNEMIDETRQVVLPIFSYPPNTLRNQWVSHRMRKRIEKIKQEYNIK